MLDGENDDDVVGDVGVGVSVVVVNVGDDGALDGLRIFALSLPRRSRHHCCCSCSCRCRCCCCAVVVVFVVVVFVVVTGVVSVRVTSMVASRPKTMMMVGVWR